MLPGSLDRVVLVDRPADNAPHDAAPPRAGSRATHWRLLLSGLALFILALAPRLIALEQHLTADDREWIRDASRFGHAWQEGRLRETYQRIHPGVTVLWLSALSIGPERSARLARESGDRERLVNAPAFVGAVFDTRRLLAWTTSALTVGLALLAWRLLGPGPAILAGLLLAGEPFLVAHGRLFHADPLLAHLMAVSLLAALIYFAGRGGRAFLIGSGLAAGLALLTKAPAIFLFGFIPLLGLVQWGWERPRRPGSLRSLLTALVLWALAAGAVFLALWPALWVDLPGTLARFLADVRLEGETARPNGNFFFGQAVEEDVGPLFYPVVTLLRLSPITLVGLLLLAGYAFRRRSRLGSIGVVIQGSLLALVAYVVLFTLMMTISPKKIDRYLLPAYPILVVLGAFGLYLALRWTRRLSAYRSAALVGLGLAQALLVASVHPYPLSYFNPLLGGSQVARQVVVVGWGEGTEQAAAYLDARPNPERIRVTSLYSHLIDAQFRGRGVRLEDWAQADYLADYVNMEQRSLLPAALHSLTQSAAPELTVRINGLDYLRLYRIPDEVKAGR